MTANRCLFIPLLLCVVACGAGTGGDTAGIEVDGARCGSNAECAGYEQGTSKCRMDANNFMLPVEYFCTSSGKAEGAACGSWTDWECAAGLHCKPGFHANETGTSREDAWRCYRGGHREGEVCESGDWQCEPGLVCRYDAHDKIAHCATRSAFGGTCTGPEKRAGSSDYCEDGLTCSESRCQHSLGTACERPGGDYECAIPGECVDGICQVRR